MHCQEQQRDQVSLELEKPYITEVFLSTPFGSAVPAQDLRKAIQYLNNLPGGIEMHRDPKKVLGAVEHLKRMRDLGRLGTGGLPVDFSLADLQQSLAGRYTLPDLMKVIEECIGKKGYRPCPEEFEEVYEEIKGNLGRLEGMLAASYLENENQTAQIQRMTQEMDQIQRMTQEMDQMPLLLQRNQYLLEDNTSLVWENAALNSENASLNSENARLRTLLLRTYVF
ncbi:uncharacterized protein LOC134238798 [Saccostrea cucullata]|uniref:uncharacterized protein LOC134238798 n=1 Tax=Saccostrea cuccullata TaxID=36930 RepID=UPI002ED05B6F